ncbi:MAG: biotin/lipoyl-binding protein, partial [Actinobacteria bacterium]|nr:biotin/lipoyl-binding protein [Actinomycetota bacterium]
KWVEERLDLSNVGGAAPAPVGEESETLVERKTTVEVNGKRFAVKMWVPEGQMVASAGPAKAKKPARAASGSGGAAGGSGSGDVVVPMQGTIVKVNVEVGQTVAIGDSVVVLEAMKMENQIAAEKAGKVTKVNVKQGDTVGSGDVLVVIE